MRENDRAKFVELAEKRVKRAIKDLRLIGNLSNKSNYSYSDEDVRKIMKAINAEVAELKRRFEQKGEKDEIEFSLN